MASTKSASSKRNTSSKNNSSSKAGSSSKKNTSVRNNAASKNESAKKNAARGEQEYIQEEIGIGNEIAVWVIGAVMLILELANFGLCGAVRYVSCFFFGIFGVIQYIIPMAFLFSAFFLHVNEYKKRAVQKVVFGFLVLLCIGMISQMAEGGLDTNDFIELLKELFKLGFGSEDGGHAGGGILCGSLAFLLNKAVGEVGTYIIIILAIIICILLFTETSLINLIKNITGDMMTSDDGYDEDEDEFEEERIRRNRKKSRKVKSERNPDFDEIVIEDYSDGRREGAVKKSGNLLESIEVLSDSPDKTDKTGKKTDKLPDDEEVHEITMDVPVNLPGENMDAFSNKTDIITEKYDPYEDAQVLSLSPIEDDEALPAPKKTRSRKSSVNKPVKEANVVSDAKETSAIGDTLTNSEKEAVMNMENKTAKEEKNLSAKEVGSSDSDYKFPPIELLKPGKSSGKLTDNSVKENAIKLQEVLKSFGVNVTMTNYSCGPSVTRYEMVPEQGVKVSKITGLADDIMMNLAAQSIRIEAPIPGKSAVGIEIPNGERSGVGFRELIDTQKFIKHPSKIAFAVGKDIEGNVVVEDIAKMPHLLIAGATGSGKSVCTNTLIMSILYKARPDEVKLILVDPKQVELKVYNGIPHLLTPVVTDPKKAAGALNWAVAEMTDRYQKFSECNVRNIQGYNDKVRELEESGEVGEDKLTKMPQIVIIVDELADLMMVAKAEVEEAIVRLAQLARAAGIHLVIATQRPSVDVVTGLIKANVPSRIALSVSSGIDSRTIIDTVGAEKLLGNGDMLFYPTMYPKPLRVQGAYISDDEVLKVVEFLKANNGETTYSEEMTNKITSSAAGGAMGGHSDGGSGDDRDEYFVQAGKFIIEKNKASIGMLQRMFKIGFNRAARIMDQLSEAGVVGPEVGTKPREVLMTEEQFEEYVDEYF